MINIRESHHTQDIHVVRVYGWPWLSLGLQFPAAKDHNFGFKKSHDKLVYKVWFGLVGLGLWHINPNRLFNAKSSLYMYIYMIWFGWVLWHINDFRLFNAKSSLYVYNILIWFGRIL